MMAFLSYALLLACNHGLQHEQHNTTLKSWCFTSNYIKITVFLCAFHRAERSKKLNYHIMLGTLELKQISPAIQYALCFTPDRAISQCLLRLFNHHHHLQLHQTNYVQNVLTSLCCSTLRYFGLIILPLQWNLNFHSLPVFYTVKYKYENQL